MRNPAGPGGAGVTTRAGAGHGRARRAGGAGAETGVGGPEAGGKALDERAVLREARELRLLREVREGRGRAVHGDLVRDAARCVRVRQRLLRGRVRYSKIVIAAPARGNRCWAPPSRALCSGAGAPCGAARRGRIDPSGEKGDQVVLPRLAVDLGVVPRARVAGERRGRVEGRRENGAEGLKVWHADATHLGVEAVGVEVRGEEGARVLLPAPAA